MTSNATTVTRWDNLNADPRHRLIYPSEHVIRWLNTVPRDADRDGPRALDIGCGHGRHLSLFRVAGFEAEGVDLFKTVSMSPITIASMTELPFDTDTFDAVLAYGVFYYATMGDADRAVQEMHRVMRPGGHGFISVRSCRDWRADHVDSQGVFHLDGHPEDGMLLDFVSEDEVNDIYGIFSSVGYEISEWTTDDRDRLNSDWLITVTK